jgi:hypothetical protein
MGDDYRLRGERESGRFGHTNLAEPGCCHGVTFGPILPGRHGVVFPVRTGIAKSLTLR